MIYPLVGRARIKRLADDNIARAKGNFMAHSLGFSLFWYVYMSLIQLPVNIPYTGTHDIPIRLVLIWQILDHTNRIKKFRANFWDLTYLLLVTSFVLSSLYADVFLARYTGGIGIVSSALNLVAPWFFFIAVREASLRKFFRLDIMLYWAIATATSVALLGIGQSINFAGVRDISASVFNWLGQDRLLYGSSAEYQARGPFAHANGQTTLLSLALCVIPIMLGSAKLRKWGYFVAGALLVGIFATYSRLGMLCIFAVAGALTLLLFRRKLVFQGITAVTFLALGVVLFIGSIIVFDIERFKVLVEGEGVVAKQKYDQIGGWYGRAEAMNEAQQSIEKFPVFGVGGVGETRSNRFVISTTPYSVPTIFNSYMFGFAAYGIFGLAFVVGQIGFLLYHGFSKRYDIWQAAAFVSLAIALAWTGVGENTNFFPIHMGFVNFLVPLMLLPLYRTEPKETTLLPETA